MSEASEKGSHVKETQEALAAALTAAPVATEQLKQSRRETTELLQKQVTELKQQLETAKSRTSLAENALYLQTQELNRLQQDYDDAQAALQTRTNTELLVQSLQAELEQERAQHASALDEMKQKMEAQQLEMEARADRSREVAAELIKANMFLEQANIFLEQANMRAQQHWNGWQETKEQKAKLEGELAVAQERIRDLENQLEQLKRDYSQLDAENQAMKLKLDNLEKMQTNARFHFTDVGSLRKETPSEDTELIETRAREEREQEEARRRVADQQRLRQQQAEKLKRQQEAEQQREKAEAEAMEAVRRRQQEAEQQREKAETQAAIEAVRQSERAEAEKQRRQEELKARERLSTRTEEERKARARSQAKIKTRVRVAGADSDASGSETNLVTVFQQIMDLSETIQARMVSIEAKLGASTEKTESKTASSRPAPTGKWASKLLELEGIHEENDDRELNTYLLERSNGNVQQVAAWLENRRKD